MKICLIEPPKFVSLTNLVSTIAMPPIGIAYIAAACRKAGHEVRLVDAHGEGLSHYFPFKNMRLRGLPFAEIIARIPKDSEIIGFGLMFSAAWPVVRDLIQEVRNHFPNAKLILGGEHGTGAPKLSLEQSPLDFVVMGEGEEVIVNLLNAISKKENPENLPGIAFRNSKNEIVINKRHNRIANIDDIPWPAWDLVDLETYIRVNQPHGAAQGRFIPMLATRGCPFQCTFCTSPEMWTTDWIARDPKLLVDEMKTYYDKMGVRDFQFEDLTFIVKRDWIIAFCKEVVERGLTDVSFQLPSGTRSEVVDDEVAMWLKKAGCHEFAFAPESGDPRILKLIKKRVKLDKMYEAARSAMRAKINVGCFFILGFPEDDWMSVLRTYKAVIKCAWIGFTNVNLNAYSPQPNTESFNALVKEGVITDQSDEYLMSLFTFQDFGMIKTSYNKKFSGFQVSLFVLLGVMLFYTCYFGFRPKRVLQLFIDIFSPKATNKSTKMVKSFLGDLGRILGQRFLPERAKAVQ